MSIKNAEGEFHIACETANAMVEFVATEPAGEGTPIGSGRFTVSGALTPDGVGTLRRMFSGIEFGSCEFDDTLQADNVWPHPTRAGWYIAKDQASLDAVREAWKGF